LRRLIRDVPDFPKPGILFRDMTPLMADAPALRTCIDLLAAVVAAWKPELIIGIESRGFIFGVPVALALGIGFAPIRKPGKLPHQRVSRKYQLEYGHDVIEMHADAVRTGLRVAIVDDLLATGGTAGAAAEMVREQGANLVGLAFVVELAGLQGRARLGGAAASSLITY
jgi:adenine phosphoribosyltransferase